MTRDAETQACTPAGKHTYALMRAKKYTCIGAQTHKAAKKHICWVILAERGNVNRLGQGHTKARVYFLGSLHLLGNSSHKIDDC